MTDFDKYKLRGAYHYEWYDNNTFNYKDCVDRCVDFCKGSTLDVGCGEGVLVEKIMLNGHNAVGIDNNEEAISLSQVPAMLHDINQSVKGKWEYMACLNVIEHLEKPERIREIFNQNITKAAIIITDVPGVETDPYHFHEFTPYELSQMFHTRKVKKFMIGQDFHGIEVYK